MPACNAEKYIGAAVESVVAQTFADWELVIVDDGSVDSTAEIVRAVHDDRIVLIQQHNAGVEAARQSGFGGCEAEFVARMDADDLMCGDRLETQVAYLRSHPEIGAMGGQIKFLGQDGQRSGFRSCWPLTHEEICLGLPRLQCTICNATLMYRAHIARLTTPTDRGGPGADVGFQLQLARLTRLANLPTVVMLVRIHPDSIQSSFDPLAKLKRTHYSVLCHTAALQGHVPPDWEEFGERWSQRPWSERLRDRKSILLGRLVRRAQSYALEGRFFPQAMFCMALAGVLAPVKSLTKALKIMSRRVH